MNLYMLAERVGMRPDISVLVLTFFAYSFIGNIMECVVLTIENKRPVTNRGFTRHLPFCIIYGFGAILGYAILSPLKDNMVALYLVGAVAATGFEFFVGNLQLKMFGTFWWDYSNKPFNYKGMLCLESTLGWGIVAVVIIRYLHGALVGLISMVPPLAAQVLAAGLLLLYAGDFLHSARAARREKLEQGEHAGHGRKPILK